MDKFLVTGGIPLKGTIHVSGAKNSALPCMAAAILTEGEVVLENKLYYQAFGLEIDGRAAPDHLLTQLEFLAWLDHCEAAGNADLQSVRRARGEFLERHLAHWVGSLAHLAENSGGGCYAELLEALAREVESALG